jgi:hypothetical protein
MVGVVERSLLDYKDLTYKQPWINFPRFCDLSMVGERLANP